MKLIHENRYLIYALVCYRKSDNFMHKKVRNIFQNKSYGELYIYINLQDYNYVMCRKSDESFHQSKNEGNEPFFFAIDFADSKSYSYGGRILNFICRKLLYRLRRIRLCTKNRCLGCTSRDTSIYTITRKFGDFFDKSHCTAPPAKMQYMKI